MSRSKSIAAETNSGLRIARSSKTRLVAESSTARLYAHTIRELSGHYVVVALEDGRPISHWETAETIGAAYEVFDTHPGNW